MALEQLKCIFARYMRLWIALFLISLFAFQALPVTALGNTCVKAKMAPSEAPAEDGTEDDNPIPEPGKQKKSLQSIEDYYHNPASQRIAKLGTSSYRCSYAPMLLMAAATGHAQLHTPPPDRR